MTRPKKKVTQRDVTGATGKSLGKGLFRQLGTTFNLGDPEQLAEFDKLFNDNKLDDWHEHCDEIEALAAETLRKAKLPDSLRPVIIDKKRRTWQEMNGEKSGRDIPKGKSLGTGSVLAEPLSPEDFAYQALRWAQALRNTERKGDVSEAAHAALQLEASYWKLIITLEFEPTLLKERKRLDGLHGGESRQQAREFVSNLDISNLNKSSILQKCRDHLAELGLDPHTDRTLWGWLKESPNLIPAHVSKGGRRAG